MFLTQLFLKVEKVEKVEKMSDYESLFVCAAIEIGRELRCMSDEERAETKSWFDSEIWEATYRNSDQDSSDYGINNCGHFFTEKEAESRLWHIDGRFGRTKTICKVLVKYHAEEIIEKIKSAFEARNKLKNGARSSILEILTGKWYFAKVVKLTPVPARFGFPLQLQTATYHGPFLTKEEAAKAAPDWVQIGLCQPEGPVELASVYEQMTLLLKKVAQNQS